jgi:hypothetical protein
VHHGRAIIKGLRIAPALTLNDFGTARPRPPFGERFWQTRGSMADRKIEDEPLQMTHPEQAGATSHDLGPNSAIGRRLKAYYDDVASEPVPDRFLSLLDALDAAESGAQKPERG